MYSALMSPGLLYVWAATERQHDEAPSAWACGLQPRFCSLDSVAPHLSPRGLRLSAEMSSLTCERLYPPTLGWLWLPRNYAGAKR
jgi:hypothetical protein